MWNSRQRGGTAFTDAYEALIRQYSSDYAEVHDEKSKDQDLSIFFDGFSEFYSHEIANPLSYDYKPLQGRLFSSSCSPKSTDPIAAALISDLQGKFDRFQRDGRIIMPYTTQLFVGKP